MNFKFTCPACGKQLSASESLVGRQKSCPRCRTKFTVPTPQQAALRSPAAEAHPAESSEHPTLLFASKGKKDEELIDMTAMVDIVFFLLIFFLVTSLQSLESVINLPTPQASAASGVRTATDFANDPNYVTVTIEDDDRVFVEDEETIGERDLRSKLRAAREKNADLRGMMVSGAPDASHGTFVMVVGPRRPARALVLCARFRSRRGMIIAGQRITLSRRTSILQLRQRRICDTPPKINV
ncbi:MAG: biopolymer transporter ExbD [Pirellulales bacterium]